MQIVDAGHHYILDCFDPTPGHEGQHSMKFVKREGPGYPFNRGIYGGTNCQEVLRALIDRTEYLNRQQPCAETEAAAGLLRAALLLFELRAARRHGRSLDLPSTQHVLSGETCEKCGHVGCKKSCIPPPGSDRLPRPAR